MVKGKKGFRNINVSKTTTGKQGAKRLCGDFQTREGCRHGQNCNNGRHLCDVVVQENPVKVCLMPHAHKDHQGGTIAA